MKQLFETKFALGGSRFLWTLSRDESFALLDSYSGIFDCPFLDTADSYVQWAEGRQGGESEEIIGDWVSRLGRRGAVFICTKVGKKHGRIGLSYKNIVQSTFESLKRLQTSYVDLLMLHTWTEDSESADAVEALSYLYKMGIARHLGLSNFPVDVLKIIHYELIKNIGVGISFVQYHYNLIERDSTKLQFDKYSVNSNFGFESQILPWVEEQGITSMPYHPLARGFLSGKSLGHSNYSESIHKERTDKYHTYNVRPLLLAMEELSKKYFTGISNIALAWLISRGKNVIPVVSFSSTHQLFNLASVPSITPNEVAQLTNLSNKINVY